MITYVAFLRGINVSGHHKVPMAELREEMAKMNYEQVITLLNSGNVIFDAAEEKPEKLEKTISLHLAETFGFPIPTIIRKAEMIEDLLANNPFEQIELTKAIRFYISFLWEESKTQIEFPWTSEDGSFNILEKRDKSIISVLDLSVTKTPKGMEALEKMFGKNMTTRNWNTIKRVGKKLEERR